MSDVVLVGLLGLIGVLITTGGTITVAFLRKNSNKLDQIHVLVNDRMDKAQDEIARLTALLTEERNKNTVTEE